jgi:hypothetical protein
MDPCHIDINGFWLEDANAKGPERVPIAKYLYAGLVMGGPLCLDSNSGFEPASVMLQLIYRRKGS